MDVPFAWFVFALVALVATLSVTEMVRVFAHRLRAIDSPGGRRVHRRPTARLGGLGIYWGFYVAIGLATYGQPFWGGSFRGDDFGLIGMMVGSSMLLIVGVMDDVYGLNATVKLGFQSTAGLLLYGFGWRIEHLGLPGLGAISVGILSLPLTVLWVLLVTNAINLIDGLDGLACGLALVSTLSICVLLAGTGGPLLLAAAALAGSLLGFLWFNLNPALIFMGDAGSLFVGFMLAAMPLRAGQLSPPGFFPMVPILLLIVPLFDTFDAVRRRTREVARGSRGPLDFLRGVKRHVFAPDGLHVHHRLIRAGYSTRRAVALLWGVAAMFAVSGCLLPHDQRFGLLMLGACVLVVGRGVQVLRSRLAKTVPAPQTLPTPHAMPMSDVVLVPGEPTAAQESSRHAA